MEPRDVSPSYVSRVLVTIALVVLAVLTVYFLGKLLGVLLLIFAAVLMAVAITGVRRVIDHFTPLSKGWSLAATYLLLILLLGGSVAVILPQLSEQIPKFVDKLPQAIDRLVDLVDRVPWAREVIERANGENGADGFDIPEHVLGVFSTTMGTIASLSLIVLIAIYLTLSSNSYVNNLLVLIPRSRRGRAGELFRAQTKSLRFWLLGRLASMVFVGVFAWIGLFAAAASA